MLVALWLAWQHQRALMVAMDQPPVRAVLQADQRGVVAGEMWRMLGWRVSRPSLPETHDLRAALLIARQHYPLEAAIWLRLAEVNALLLPASSSERVGELDAAVALAPGSHEVLWRAAMVAMQHGDEARAVRWLAALLAAGIDNPVPALSLLDRLVPDADTLVDVLLADHPALLPLLATRGWGIRRGEIGRQALQRIPETDWNPALLLPAVNATLRSGDVAEAAALWRRVDPDFARHGVANADFSHRPGQGAVAFDWRGQVPDGVRWSRDLDDYHTAPASLRWRFSASSNVNLQQPFVPLPVEPGQRYRLQLAWKGQRLGSSSLPELQVLDERRRSVLSSAPSPARQWDWQNLALEFEVPAGQSLVHLRLHRARARTHDWQLDGQINIDALRLSRAGEP